ncbi:MAG: ABC transporter ATP-binding protein [Sporichthyaceae bacterium]
MDLRLNDVHAEIGKAKIVNGVSVTIRQGQIAGLIGPNGSGKSTLLRTLYRHLKPAKGSIVLGEDDLWKISARQNALRVAAVPQEHPTEFEFTVREVVAMGRLPHTSGFAGIGQDQQARIDQAMATVGVEHLTARSFATLSGGERQRVLVARALVQATPVIVLDEPTNHLDIRHQLDLLELLRSLKLTTVMAIHDLNLAAAYCDTLYVLKAGRLVAGGPTHDVLTPELIGDVFEVDCERHVDADGTLRLAFHPRRRVPATTAPAPATAPATATAAAPAGGRWEQLPPPPAP